MARKKGKFKGEYGKDYLDVVIWADGTISIKSVGREGAYVVLKGKKAIEFTDFLNWSKRRVSITNYKK